MPDALIGSLQRAITAREVTWGVELAPAIVEQMTRLMSVSEGGNLVILSSGRVQLEAQ